MSKLLITGIAVVSALSLAIGQSQAQTYYGSGCCACGGVAVSAPATMYAPAQVATPGPAPLQANRQPAGVQSYQRYSYAPAGTPSSAYSQPSAVGSTPVASAPMYVAPSYRSYSNQSSYYSGEGYSRNLGNLWQYPKGDMRRQMH